MKYRKNKEKKKEEDSGKKYGYKSEKVMGIAKELEHTLSKKFSKSHNKDNRDVTHIIHTKVDYENPDNDRAVGGSVRKKKPKRIFEDL